MTATWRDAAQEAGATLELLNVVDTVAGVHGLYECARGGGGEVGLGPAPDAYAAAYVGRNGMSLALSPEQAAQLTRLCQFKVQARNQTTHYVRVPNDRLTDEETASRVRQALEQAVIRSWGGPRWNRGLDPAGQGRPSPSCPVHHYRLSVTGFCMGCDDTAPTL